MRSGDTHSADARAGNARVTHPGVAGAVRAATAIMTRGRMALAAAFDGGYRPASPLPAGAPSLTLDGISAGYGGRLAIEGVSGQFAPGSLTALVGPNGAGKSTLLNVLAGVRQPRTGSVTLEFGGAVADRAATIAYLPQTTAIDRDYPISVLEFAALGRWRRFGAFRTPPYDLLADVLAALQTVGLQDHAAARISQLSVGQFRRVLFARLIVQRARLVLLDEPFAAVDERTASDLLLLLRAWHGEGRTVIAALHDLGQVREVFPQTLLLAGQVIAWGETTLVLSPDNVARVGMGTGMGSGGPADMAEREPRGGMLRLVPV